MAGILEVASRNIDMVTTQFVKGELEEIKQYDDPVAQAAEEILRIIYSGDIETLDVQNKDAKEMQTSYIDQGEASCFVLAKDLNIKTLVMDDVKAASALEGLAIKEGIDQRISVAVIIELLNKSVISEGKAKTCIKDMITDRGWKGGVLEILAERYLSED